VEPRLSAWIIRTRFLKVAAKSVTIILLFGDYDGFNLPSKASSEEIDAAIKKCIDAGVDAVWPGCDIWPDVKPENMQAINDAIKEFGRVSTPAVGRL